jgi:hypothetical protein
MLVHMESRNDIIFDNSPVKTYIQVLLRATYWCRQWALLQSSEENNREIKDACLLGDDGHTIFH